MLEHCDFLLLYRRNCSNVPVWENTTKEVDVSDAVGSVDAVDDCCIVLYGVRTSLRLPTAGDWSVTEVDALRVVVSCDLNDVRPVSVVNNVMNGIHVSRDVPKNIGVVLMEDGNVVRARVVTIGL